LGFSTNCSCHFDSPIEANPHQFRQAFAFLEKKPIADESKSNSLPEEDFELLREIDQGLSKLRITPPPKEKV
jgi:hypothetical protein